MSTEALDEQINIYMSQLNERQKLAILSVAKTFAEEKQSLLDEPFFIEEMDKRIEELDSGKVKGRRWEDVKQRTERSTANEDK